MPLSSPLDPSRLFPPNFPTNSDLNDVIVHPEGSYTELEHLLMRLGLVTEIRPHASSQYDENALWAAVGAEERYEDDARRQACALRVVGGAFYHPGV